MDIMYLLDQLEEVLGAGQSVPFTTRKLVDEQECLDILDQIRVAIPEEIKAARRLTQERDLVIAEARAEAERLLREADQQVAGRISSHELVRAAEARAAEIEEEALGAAEEIRREADAYAYRVLEKLRGQVEHVSQAIDRGLRDLEAEEPPTQTQGRRRG